MNVRRVAGGVITTLLILLIAATSAFKCPEHCHCTKSQRQLIDYNHAKCSSLDGLWQLEVESDIHSLDLSDISIEKITSQLDKLTNLTKLNLQSNRLSEINNLSNKRIRVLNLSNNRITSGKLNKIPVSVKHLKLSNNEITYLPIEFKKLVNLKSLELSENPINCTCETLEVRNWLQAKQVWTDNPVKCSAPLQFKGRPWLQIRQSDVCDYPNGLDEPHILPYAHADDENDLMLGDDPDAAVITTKSSELGDEEEELGKDFLPVDEEHVKKASHDHENAENNNDEEVEGSGDETDSVTTVTPETHNNEEVYEGSGDDHDIEPLVIAKAINPVEYAHEANNTNVGEEAVTTTEPNETTETELTESNFETVTISEVFDIQQNESETEDPNTEATAVPRLLHDVFDTDLKEVEEPKLEETTTELPITDVPNTEAPQVPSISKDDTLQVHRFEGSNAIEGENKEPVKEEKIVPVKATSQDTEIIKGHSGDNNTASAPVKLEDTKNGKKSDVRESQSTYILLGILGILIVFLIVYVATKRGGKGSSKNRRNKSDAENPAQELSTMDKNNLGKPLRSNGTEIIPLIGPNNDKRNNLSNIEEPLLKKLSVPEDEDKQNSSNNVNEVPNKLPSSDNNDSAVHPETPIHQNGGVSDPIQNGGLPETIQNGSPSVPRNSENDTSYQPISPKPSRYSPVYSHETGRVKIKLTETAKPKTPILVTRGRSNAGDNKFVNQINQ